MKTLLLSMDDVGRTLSMKEVIEAVKEGYVAFQKGKVQQPDIVSMEMPHNNGETDMKFSTERQVHLCALWTAAL